MDFLRFPDRGTSTQVCSDIECHASGRLVGSDWKDRTTTTIMAPSMGYVFYRMELLAMAMRTMASG